MACLLEVGLVSGSRASRKLFAANGHLSRPRSKYHQGPKPSLRGTGLRRCCHKRASFVFKNTHAHPKEIAQQGDGHLGHAKPGYPRPRVTT